MCIKCFFTYILKNKSWVAEWNNVVIFNNNIVVVEDLSKLLISQVNKTTLIPIITRGKTWNFLMGDDMLQKLRKWMTCRFVTFLCSTTKWIIWSEAMKETIISCSVHCYNFNITQRRNEFGED